jgi:hypothetical protein
LIGAFELDDPLNVHLAPRLQNPFSGCSKHLTTKTPY